jgi:hypothetical protein
MMIDDDRKNSCYINGAAQQLDALHHSPNRDYSVSKNFQDSLRYCIPNTSEGNRTEFISRKKLFSYRCIILDSSKLADVKE